MEYLVYCRFRGRALCGEVNLPAGTVVDCTEEGLLFYRGKPLCLAESENAHLHFARNDDGQGWLRGQLSSGIRRRLEKRDRHYQQRWDRVWNDPVCQPYKRSESADYWLWNHAFFQAEIDVLRHIAKLVGVKEGLPCIKSCAKTAVNSASPKK